MVRTTLELLLVERLEAAGVAVEGNPHQEEASDQDDHGGQADRSCRIGDAERDAFVLQVVDAGHEQGRDREGDHVQGDGEADGAGALGHG